MRQTLSILPWAVLALPFSGLAVENMRTLPVVHTAPSHHAEDGFFRNPYIGRHLTTDSSSEGWRTLGRWWRLRKHFPDWHEQGAGRVPQVRANRQRIQQPDEVEPQFTWLGHSMVLVQYRGINVLTDPIFSRRCSPVPFLGPRRVTPPALKIEELPRVHYVLISHNHYDHLDRATVRALGDEPLWLAPLGIGEWLQKAGISPQRVQEFDWWQQAQWSDVRVTATPSQHWSGRGLNDRYQTLWASWHVQIGDFSLWFAGDTGYNPHQFTEIGLHLPTADLALIPIGAYRPREFMQKSHVSPEEAVQIFLDTGARYAIGVHWGTFQLSAEDIDAPIRDLATARRKFGVSADRFEAPILGETRRPGPLE